MAERFGQILLCNLICGLHLKSYSASEIKILPGFCSVPDPSGDIVRLEDELIISLENTGKNGLDTGSEAASTWYYIYIIKNIKTLEVAGLFSASPDNPTLPQDFTLSKRIGVVRNNSSSDLFRFYQTGSGTSRLYWFNEDQFDFIALDDGNALNPTEIDLTNFMPSTARDVYLSVNFATGASGLAGDFVRLRPAGSGNNTPSWAIRPAIVGNVKSFWQVRMPVSSDQKIEYWVIRPANSVTIVIQGFIDSLR